MTTNSYDNQNTDTIDRLQKKLNLYIGMYTYTIQEGSSQREFGFGNQWDNLASALAKQNSITPLQQNELSKHIKSVVAEFASNLPTPTTQALSPKLNDKTVDLFSNILDAAIKKNGYKDAITLAYEDALRTGCGGGIYVYTDYMNENDFKQDIYFKYISYTELFFDPYAQLPTKADGDFCGYLQRIPSEEFRALFPDIKIDDIVSINPPFSNYNQLDATGDGKESIMVAHFFERQYEDQILYLTDDGRVLFNEEELNRNERVIRTRKTKDRVIYAYMFDGKNILRKNKYPIKELPLIYLSGYQAIIDNQICPFSFGIDVFDTQKLKNWSLSQIANMVLNLRKESFVVDIKELSQEDMRVFINPLLQQGCIPYHSDKNAPPQQLRPPELSSTLIGLVGESGKEIDNILGRFEDVQGASSADVSGIARQLSITQNNIALYFYVRHAVSACEQICKVVSQFLPKVYLEERLVVNDNNKIVVNGMRQYEGMENIALHEINLHDLNVNVKVGAAFEIQKQRYMEALAELIQKLPPPLNTVLLPNLLALYDIPNSADVNKKLEQVMKITNPTIGQIMEGISDEQLEGAVQMAQQTAQQQQQLQQQLQQYELQAQQSKQQIEQETLKLKAQQQQLEELKALSGYQTDTERLDQNAQQMALTQQQNQQKTTAEITKAYMNMMGSHLSAQ